MQHRTADASCWIGTDIAQHNTKNKKTTKITQKDGQRALVPPKKTHAATGRGRRGPDAAAVSTEKIARSSAYLATAVKEGEE